MKGAVENWFELNGKDFIVNLFRNRKEFIASMLLANRDYTDVVPAELAEAVTKKQGRPFKLVKLTRMEFAGYPEQGNRDDRKV